MRRAIVVLLALPLVLVACGGGSGKAKTAQSGASPLAQVKAAVQKNAAATSEHLAMKAAVTAGGTAVSLDGTGDFDQKAHKGTLHATFSAGGLTGAIDEVTDGTTFYMKSPLFASMLPAGKTWLKLDLQKSAKAQGFDLSALMNQDPSQTVAQLKGLENVKEIGKEDVGGVATTHYRGRLDVSKVPQGKKILTLTNAKYGPYDVWVGDDGYVRRIRFSATFAAQSAPKTTMKMTMDLSDFGKMVDVAVPAASDTVDATDASIPGIGA